MIEFDIPRSRAGEIAQAASEGDRYTLAELMHEITGSFPITDAELNQFVGAAIRVAWWVDS